MTAIALNTMCLVADGRSIDARRWATHLARAGITGTLLSSRRLTRPQRRAWRSNCGGFQVVEPAATRNVGRQALPAARNGTDDAAAGDEGLRTTLDLWGAKRLARRLEHLHREHPLTLVHALRIPFEGIGATLADLHVPTVVSASSQELSARAGGRIAEHVRRTLDCCEGFMADISHAVARAESLGLPVSTPRLLVPGNMGLDVPALRAVLARGPQGERPPLVVCPCGPSTFVDASTFLESIPRVLRKRPDARILCVGIARERRAVGRAGAFGTAVELLDLMSQDELWKLFTHAAVVVSPGRGSRLPSSVLEAAALGAVPVVYEHPYAEDLTSAPVRGYSVPHEDPDALTAAVVEALSVPVSARRDNTETVLARYGAEPNLERVVEFYDHLVR